MQVTVYSKKGSIENSKTFPVEMYYIDTTGCIYFEFQYVASDDYDPDVDIYRKIGVNKEELLRAVRNVSKYPSNKFDIHLHSDSYNSYPRDRLIITGQEYHTELEETTLIQLEHFKVFFNTEELIDTIEILL